MPLRTQQQHHHRIPCITTSFPANQIKSNQINPPPSPPQSYLHFSRTTNNNNPSNHTHKLNHAPYSSPILWLDTKSSMHTPHQTTYPQTLNISNTLPPNFVHSEIPSSPPDLSFLHPRFKSRARAHPHTRRELHPGGYCVLDVSARLFRTCTRVWLGCWQLGLPVRTLAEVDAAATRSGRRLGLSGDGGVCKE